MIAFVQIERPTRPNPGLESDLILASSINPTSFVRLPMPLVSGPFLPHRLRVAGPPHPVVAAPKKKTIGSARRNSQLSHVPIL